MLSASLHVGHSLNTFNSEIKGILLGLRKKIFILDLKISILQYKIISNLIINLISKRHPILLIKEFNYINFQKYISDNWSLPFLDIVIYEGKWIGGSLTNYKFVLNSSKIKTFNLKNLSTYNRFPSLVCFFNSNFSNWALLESYNLRIPISSLINSDSLFFKLINYPVNSNNRNINSSLFYISVICNSILYGKKKEVSRILKLSYLLKDELRLKRNVFSHIALSFLEHSNLKKKECFWFYRRKTKFKSGHIREYSKAEIKRNKMRRSKLRW